MSNNGDKIVQSNDYRQLSNEALLKKLEWAMENFGADGSVEQVIQPILDEFARREIDVPAFDARTSWEELCENHPLFFEENTASSGKKSKRKRRLRPAIAVAVIAALLASLLIAQAAGIDLLAPLAQWTKDVFYFERSESSQSSTRQNALENLEQLLRDNHVDEPVVPGWLPDDMIETELSFTKNDFGLGYYAVYSNQQDTAVLCISDWELGGNAIAYEKNPGDVQVYQVNGTDYYMMWNMDSITVVWNQGDYECSISTTLPVEDVEKIIHSFY